MTKIQSKLNHFKNESKIKSNSDLMLDLNKIHQEIKNERAHHQCQSDQCDQSDQSDWSDQFNQSEQHSNQTEKKSQDS